MTTGNASNDDQPHRIAAAHGSPVVAPVRPLRGGPRPPEGRPTDLTDAQWEAVRPLLPAPKAGGRPRTVDLRAVLNAIRYVNAGHSSWRRLPPDLPRWGTAHSYFWVWRSDGTWARIVQAIDRADEPENAGPGA